MIFFGQPSGEYIRALDERAMWQAQCDARGETKELNHDWQVADNRVRRAVDAGGAEGPHFDENGKQVIPAEYESERLAYWREAASRVSNLVAK